MAKLHHGLKLWIYPQPQCTEGVQVTDQNPSMLPLQPHTRGRIYISFLAHNGFGSPRMYLSGRPMWVFSSQNCYPSYFILYKTHRIVWFFSNQQQSSDLSSSSSVSKWIKDLLCGDSHITLWKKTNCTNPPLALIYHDKLRDSSLFNANHCCVSPCLHQCFVNCPAGPKTADHSQFIFPLLFFYTSAVF